MDAARRKIIHDAMVRLADGDRTAFDVLLDELWPVILSFAQRGVGWGADAEDIAQEVFFRICARIADFDRGRDASSWAFGIASHEILTLRRRRQRRREVHDDASLAAQTDAAASQEDLLVNREVALALGDAVGALTEEDRRALGLLPESASNGVTAATLRKRKQRALGRLRDLWRSIHGES
jgi:RNA polymerase sigma-70 factor (ECF subfamily)